MSALNVIPGTAKVIDFEAHLNERREQSAVEQAEIAAGWFFDLATKAQKAEFTATMQSLLGMTGPKWDRARDAARAKWAADTAEARKLFDETVERFLSHGEISEELDERWTALVDGADEVLEIEAAVAIEMAE